MVGSLDVSSSNLSEEFRELLDSYNGMLPVGQEHYQGMLYRPFGEPVVAHIENEHNHETKLQFWDMPNLSFFDSWQIIQRVFSEPSDIRIVRLHLGCDVVGTPVDEFRRVRVLRKQTFNTYSAAVQDGLIKKVQTLRFGDQKNGFEIYDKVAERQNHYARYVRGAKKRNEPIRQFEEVCGFHQSETITRIERKYSNGKVPFVLNTFKALLHGAMDFNPFDTLVFCPSPKELPSIEKLGLCKYRKLVTWQLENEEYGFAEAYKRLNKYSNKNGCRELKELIAAMNTCSENPVTTEKLIDLYRAGINRQLAGWEGI